jgi:integrase
MSDLAGHVADYLRLRRALGFKLRFEGQVLPQLAAYLDAAGAPVLTAELAIAWAGLPRGLQPISLAHRLGAARGFARYLRTIDPATEVPPPGIWPSSARRPVPYLWQAADVSRLLNAARQIRPPLRAATCETLFGLLAATGMRAGEAIRLARGDVDLTGGLITVAQSKSGRVRVVPLHPTTTQALRCYAARRDQLCPRPRPASFFVSARGTPLCYGGAQKTFAQLTTAIGLRTAAVRPRMHDLRHTFAVNALIRWHQSGEVPARTPALSGYLGHVNPAGTYWYLSATPQLMELAAARLERRYGTPQ